MAYLVSSPCIKQLEENWLLKGGDSMIGHFFILIFEQQLTTKNLGRQKKPFPNKGRHHTIASASTIALVTSSLFSCNTITLLVNGSRSLGI